MLYINDPKQSHITYDDLVETVIANGIKSKRAYIYLAGLGIKGVLARVMSGDNLDYSKPIKLAVVNDKLVSEVSTCDHCHNLVIK